MPEHKVRVFVESFKKLSQIVLWKWENGTIDDLPDNVYVDKWFPQQYILSIYEYFKSYIYVNNLIVFRLASIINNNILT